MHRKGASERERGERERENVYQNNLNRASEDARFNDRKATQTHLFLPGYMLFNVASHRGEFVLDT